MVWSPFDVQQVLERDRQARKRAARDAVSARLIGCVGGSERGVVIDLDERMQMGIVRMRSAQGRLR